LPTPPLAGGCTEITPAAGRYSKPWLETRLHPYLIVLMHPPALLRFLALCAVLFSTALAQSPVPSATPDPVRAANRRLAATDRLGMLAQLHTADPLNLAALPPGQKAGPPANYDEALANPFPLTNPLRLNNGQTVKDAATWWNQRRPEILDAFIDDVYGAIPPDAPRVSWRVVKTDPAALSGTAILETVTGDVDSSAWPAASAHIDLRLYLPAKASGPVPVIVEIIAGAPGAPVAEPVALPLILARGWGCATCSTYTLQADTGAGLGNGVIGIVNHGRARTPDQWGALEAWAWGLSRAVDYLQTDKAVDATRLGVEGHSRWGKTALLCAALDSRWSLVYASCSGQCGAKPSRRFWGETLDNICGIGEYHWMAGNYLKYCRHWGDLPVDSPDLLSLIAPRPLFIGCGTKDQWADPHGQFLAVQAAAPVWKLLGGRDSSFSAQPAPDEEAISGDVGFRMHTGGHTDELDFPTFLKFAAKYWDR